MNSILNDVGWRRTANLWHISNRFVDTINSSLLGHWVHISENFYRKSWILASVHREFEIIFTLYHIRVQFGTPSISMEIMLFSGDCLFEIIDFHSSEFRFASESFTTFVPLYHVLTFRLHQHEPFISSSAIVSPPVGCPYNSPESKKKQKADSSLFLICE